jgi:hypothetical protein
MVGPTATSSSSRVCSGSSCIKFEHERHFTLPADTTCSISAPNNCEHALRSQDSHTWKAPSKSLEILDIARIDDVAA